MATLKAVPNPNPVRRAVDKLGGPTLACAAIRVSSTTLFEWLSLGFVPRAKYAVLLSEAAGVPVRDLAGLDRQDGDGGPGRRQREYGTTRAKRARSTGCSPQSVPASIPATEQDSPALPEAIGF